MPEEKEDILSSDDAVTRLKMLCLEHSGVKDRIVQLTESVIYDRSHIESFVDEAGTDLRVNLSISDASKQGIFYTLHVYGDTAKDVIGQSLLLREREIEPLELRLRLIEVEMKQVAELISGAEVARTVVFDPNDVAASWHSTLDAVGSLLGMEMEDGQDEDVEKSRS